MKIIIHRGTHQIGGSAVEISTKTTRIILDMGGAWFRKILYAMPLSDRWGN